MTPIELEPHLRSRRDSGRKLLIPYVTGGLATGRRSSATAGIRGPAPSDGDGPGRRSSAPSWHSRPAAPGDGPDWCEVVRAFADAGADAVEIGLPFSDPVMDGPTIQDASQRSLDAGTTPAGIVAALASVDVDAPLVAMTYYNLVFRAGHERFASSLASGGVSGAIVPDVPLEELDPWAAAADAAGVATVLLASPVTPDERLARIVARSRGFVYGVGLMGVTGERERVASSATILAKRLKAATDKPVVIGFGVSTPQHAVELCAEADGVVIASALMRRMLDGASPTELGEQLHAIRVALDRG